jgi:hypothetical protein
MRVTQKFVLYLHNYFFFVYRHPDLEGSCLNGTKTRLVSPLLLAGLSGSRDLTLGCGI